MRRIIIAAVLAIASGTALGADTDIRVHIVGTGSYSCGSWVSKRITDTYAQAWILGYWSGLNTGFTAMNESPTMVGSSTDGDGIIEEVRLVCRREPSLTIYAATASAYAKLRDAKR